MEAFNVEDQAAIIARSTQLSEQHRAYLAKHPALTELMHDFLTNVLVNKPDDCYQFCQEYFAGFLGGDGVGDLKEGWGYDKCRPLIIVGPSGCGKRWLAQKIVSMHKDKFGVVIGHTTRPPRAGEADKVDFIFTDRDAMDIGKEGGEFLNINDFEGQMYGTMRDRLYGIVAIGRVPIITCTPEAGLEIRKKCSDLLPVTLLLKPSGDALEKRLKALSLKGALAAEFIEPRKQAQEQLNAMIKQRPGLFDVEFTTEYTPADPLQVADVVVDNIAKWALAQDWHAQVDRDKAKAALKIQGQARRRTDSRRVHALKQQKNAKVAPPAVTQA